MTPAQISDVAHKILERFPETATAAFQNDRVRMRQVIIEELGFHTAGQSPKLRDVVRVHVCAVLEVHGWNRTRAAVELGVTTKTVLNMVARWRKEGHVIQDWNGSYR